MASNSALAPANTKPTFNFAFTQALDRREDLTAVNPPKFSSVCVRINTAQFLSILRCCCLVITQKSRQNRLNADKATQRQRPPPTLPPHIRYGITSHVIHLTTSTPSSNSPSSLARSSVYCRVFFSSLAEIRTNTACKQRKYVSLQKQ